MSSAIPEVRELRRVVISKIAQRKGRRVDQPALDGQLDSMADDTTLYNATTSRPGSLFDRFRPFARIFGFFR